MLYKNDVIFELSRFPKEVEALEAHFHGKFPVRVVYPPDRIVKSRLPHNRLPDKPASISFDLKATVKTDKGIETWRYAERVITGDYGVKQYLPAKFMFEGERVLQRNDIELIYFLLRKSEFCQGGDNQGIKTKFMFEDRVTEAEKRVEKKKIQQKIDALLYGELALPEERQRDIARAYFIDNIDNLTFSQVRLVLDNEINKSKDGPAKFFDMVDADKELSARSSVQKAKDMGLLTFETSTRTWCWAVTGGKNISICRIPANKPNATEALYDHYKGSQDFRDDVQAVLITKKPPIKEKVED